MPRYCEKCCVTTEEDRCPNCGRKKMRETRPDDLCFLTEQEQIWSDMLADVLKQQGIPFIQKSVLGAGLAIITGPVHERVRYYVPYSRLQEAVGVVEGLFERPEEEEDGEESHN